VTNVVRHARATACRVDITAVDGELQIRVADDGRGINGSPTAGHGMQTMRERAEELGGRLTVTANRTVGATVCAEIPLGATTVPIREPTTGATT
jgi:two-component system NarL family sensor kinase